MLHALSIVTNNLIFITRTALFRRHKARARRKCKQTHIAPVGRWSNIIDWCLSSTAGRPSGRATVANYNYSVWHIAHRNDQTMLPPEIDGCLRRVLSQPEIRNNSKFQGSRQFSRGNIRALINSERTALFAREIKAHISVLLSVPCHNETSAKIYHHAYIKYKIKRNFRTINHT